jgi:hypothetical protein
LAKEARINPPVKRRHKPPAAYKKEIRDRELSADLTLFQIGAEREEMETTFSAREAKRRKQAAAVRADLSRLKIGVSCDTLDVITPSKFVSIQKATALAGEKIQKSSCLQSYTKKIVQTKERHE